MPESTELSVVKGQSTKAVTEAQKLVVSDPAGLDLAANLLSKIKTAQKFIKAEQAKILDPLRESKRKAQEAMDVEQARWEPILAAAAEAERIVKSKVIAYSQEVERKAREEEEKILEARRKGEIKKESTVQKRLDEIQQAPVSVSSKSGGGLQMRKVQKLFITEAEAIPMEYWDINEARIKAAIKSGVVVTGAEIRLVDEVAGLSR